MSDSEGSDSEFEFGPSEYLVYRVLSELREQFGGENGRTKVHKLCILTERNLRQDYNREIGLPQYWYKYGQMLAESEIDTSVAYTPDANYKRGQAYYPANQVSESDFDHLSEDLKDDIFRAARETILDHGNKSYKDLEKYQYENFAPFEFIETYGDLRWYLASLSLDKDQMTFEHFTDTEQKSTIEEMLDDMLVAFDEEEFPEIHSLYLDWDDTMRLLNDNGASARELLEFTEMFIEAFAKAVLRLKSSSNVSEERIEEWRKEKDTILQDLKDKIQRSRENELATRNISGELGSVSEAYNQSIEEELKDL